MIERDYILRIIRELAVVCARILRSREAGEAGKAHQELEDAGAKYLGAKWSFCSCLSARQIIDLFGAERQPDKLTAVAELLREESDLLFAEGDTDRSALQGMKAFSIFAELASRDMQFLKILPHEKYDALLQRILEYELPDDLKDRLVTYYLLTGQLRKGGEMVDEMLASGPARAETAAAFYQKLLGQPDAVLEREGYSRRSVIAALGQLKRTPEGQ